MAIPLLFGRLTAADYEDDVPQDKRIDTLREKINCFEDPSFTADYHDPEKRAIANAITLEFTDGTRFEEVVVEYPIGHARRRQDGIPKLVDKFKINLARQFPTRQQQRILEVSLDRTRLEQMPVDRCISTCTSFKQTAVRRKFNRRALCLLANFISVRLTNRSSSGPSRPQRIDWQTPFTQTLITAILRLLVGFVKAEPTCHNAIDRWLEKQPEALALIAVSSETEEERTFTFRQLHDEVNAVASMLRSLGVQRGDRVLVYMPMIAEAHITLLACARIGVIHSVVFGGFASHSVAARIDDAKPVLIVSADAGARGGKIIPYKKLLDDAISQAQHQPRHVCWWIAGWRKWRASAGGMSISRRCAINTSARGYRWRGWNPTKPPASTPPARPANLKACSVTSADMRWRWRPRWTPFLAAKRAVCSFAASDIGWVVGHSYIVYAPLLAGMATIVYEGLPDLAGLRCVVENRREI